MFATVWTGQILNEFKWTRYPHQTRQSEPHCTDADVSKKTKARLRDPTSSCGLFAQPSLNPFWHNCSSEVGSSAESMVSLAQSYGWVMLGRHERDMTRRHGTERREEKRRQTVSQSVSQSTRRPLFRPRGSRYHPFSLSGLAEDVSELALR